MEPIAEYLRLTDENNIVNRFGNGIEIGRAKP